MNRALATVLVLLAFVAAAQAQRSFDVDILSETFGFDKDTKKSVKLRDLMQGCPARDCIPSIDNPRYVPADAAGHVADDVAPVANRLDDRVVRIRTGIAEEDLRIGRRHDFGQLVGELDAEPVRAPAEQVAR